MTMTNLNPERFVATPFLTERQAAERLGLSPKTLKAWRVAGTGPSYLKLGSSVRYHLEHLDAWAMSKAVA